MVLDWLRRRFGKRETIESYSELKERILSRPLFSEPTLEPLPTPTPRPRETPRLTYEEPSKPRIPQPLAVTPTLELEEKSRRGTETRALEKLSDDIALIKEQLAAIKAQCETINERIKVLERKLEVGY